MIRIREPKGTCERVSKLFFNARFVDEHHGDIVANGVDPLALDALQSVFIVLQFNGRFAKRTNQDFE